MAGVLWEGEGVFDVRAVERPDDPEISTIEYVVILPDVREIDAHVGKRVRVILMELEDES